MRILSLYYTHKPGGFCKRLYQLLNAAAGAGHEVYYLALDPPPETLSPNVKFRRIPFILSARSGLLFWALFCLYCPIFIFIRCLSIRPERLVVFGAFYSAMVAPSAVLLRIRVVLFLRSLVFRIDEITGRPRWLLFFTRAVDKIGVRAASTVVCMTQAMRTELEEFNGAELKNVQILPNNVEPLNSSATELKLELFLSGAFTEKTLLVVTVGVIDRRKNIDYLLSAFEELQRKYSPQEITLLVAGDGPLLSHYRALAESKSLKNVVFLGWCISIGQLLKRARLMLHPAIHEGMPNSVLEAMSVGLPVLCAATPELKELMFYDELLFDLGNSKTLVEKLELLLRSTTELELVSSLNASRAKTLSFDWGQRAIEIIKSG